MQLLLHPLLLLLPALVFFEVQVNAAKLGILIPTSQPISHSYFCVPCSYMVLFLKFIASVVPTIEYDYTLAAGSQN